MLSRTLTVYTLPLLAALFAFSNASAQKPPAILVPKGLADIICPEDNPHLEDKVELGKQLYFDKRLSKDNTISCASCHGLISRKGAGDK